MKLVGFGDSFVYGSELKREKHSWVSQCAERIGADYETTAVPGCGNDNISMQILTYFANNLKENTHQNHKTTHQKYQGKMIYMKNILDRPTSTYFPPKRNQGVDHFLSFQLLSS